MKIGFFLSSTGGSPLQVGLERGLRELGCEVEDYKPGEGYDLIAIFNQAAHCAYHYPEFPKENTPVAFVDSAEYGFFKRLPGVAHGYHNTFSKGALAHDTKIASEQWKLKRFLEGRSFPYFIREYLKFLKFPDSYHPIDYPLYALSWCATPPNREEYLRRQQDLFVSWGLSHPWRNNLTAEMRSMPIRSQILVLEENGTPRMPQGEFFARTSGAKCSVSFDGYGSSSFRLTEVLIRAVLLRGPLSMRCRADLTDGVNCVDYQVTNNGENYIASNLRQKIEEVLGDPERAFRIYEAGYHHCMDHLTERATADYFLNTVVAHDWNTPTPLDL